MKKHAIILLALCAGTAAQEIPRPAPYIALGGSLNGAGYARFSGIGSAGVEWEPRYLLLTAEATYATGGKSNDNDNTSSAGHSRQAEILAAARLTHGWFAGPGVSWSKTYTPLYTKSATRPTCTIGKDMLKSRYIVTYIDRGTDWQNGLRAIQVSARVYIRRHWFLDERFSGSWFHATITDRSNPALVKQERAEGNRAAKFESRVGFQW